jgi:hypothetical protein
MMTNRREIEYISAKDDERDEVYNQIIAALTPAVVIESFAPAVPKIEEEPENQKKQW